MLEAAIDESTPLLEVEVPPFVPVPVPPAPIVIVYVSAANRILASFDAPPPDVLP
jgi:hypothetical protein